MDPSWMGLKLWFLQLGGVFSWVEFSRLIGKKVVSLDRHFIFSNHGLELTCKRQVSSILLPPLNGHQPIGFLNFIVSLVVNSIWNPPLNDSYFQWAHFSNYTSSWTWKGSMYDLHTQFLQAKYLNPIFYIFKRVRFYLAKYPIRSLRKYS